MTDGKKEKEKKAESINKASIDIVEEYEIKVTNNLIIFRQRKTSYH